MSKPVLKTNRKVSQEMDYGDFEKFVQECYGFTGRQFKYARIEPVYPELLQKTMDERLLLSCKDILTDDDKKRLTELNAVMNELTGNGNIRISSLAIPQEEIKIEKPVEYSFVATEECGNDSEHSFSPTGEIEDYDLNDAAKIRSGKGVSSNYLLFECLVADGFLEAGEYTVNVCW